MTSPSSTKLQVSTISKTFASKQQRTEVLHDISFSVGQHEVVCVVGPSGCGKSTLFNVISGLDEPSSGSVSRDGRLAMMFQDPALLPWLTVEKNVGFGLTNQQPDKVEQYLKIVGLEQFGRAFPHELSGGMKQRAALARTLIIEPNIILMDEPFSALDAQTRERLQQFVQTLLQDYPVSIVFVTHDIREAVLLGDRVLILSQRPAQVVREYTIALPRPRRSFDSNLDSYIKEITHEMA
ncbi:MAG: hypothetical protein ACD_41C00287G0012 [uncultured bacterium]|nr:MAG: hypothetical protein ACD_41C00287G0012 [uncultured bacterium]HBY74117.1 nitrate ABC transporter ATP-binding protein [Candidatus Kerfeldbacteria bacterium]